MIPAVACGLLLYTLFGVMAAMMTAAALEDVGTTGDQDLQLVTTAGVLWPLATPVLPVAALYGLYRLSRYVVGGVSLARAQLLPARATLPQARLVERG